MRRSALVGLVTAGLLSVGCQSGATTGSSCTPAADKNPFGTDGTNVLACQNGRWVHVMTVQEFLRAARGEKVTPAPAPPTTAPATTTTVSGSTVDQQLGLDPNTPDSFSPMQCPNDQTRSQTFTAGRSGTLDKVSLMFHLAGAGAVMVHIDIYDAAQSGGPGSTKLGEGDYDGPAPSNEAFVDIPLPDTAPVTQGEQYAIVISTAAGCVGGFDVMGEDDGYAGGSHYTTTIAGPMFVDVGSDLRFRTWVL